MERSEVVRAFLAATASLDHKEVAEILGYTGERIRQMRESLRQDPEYEERPELRMRTRIWTDKEGNETGRTTKLGLQYKSVNSVTRKWSVVHAYGGLLTENVVQATARDLMAAAMLRLERAGYPVVLTVHDEVVCEVPEDHGDVATFNSIMEILPPWAQGCPIRAESWEGERYRK